MLVALKIAEIKWQKKAVLIIDLRTYLNNRNNKEVDIQSILSDKSVKAKAKVSVMGNALISNEISINEMIAVAKNSNVRNVPK